MIPLSNPDFRRTTTAYVTLLLIFTNVVIFLYELKLNDLDTQLFFYRFGVIPAELAQGENFTRLILGAGLSENIASPIPTWGTVFSSMFIHGGFLHLVGNMMFLWFYGKHVEDKMGHVKFLLFYLIAGIAAVWAQVGVDMGSQVPTIGASGAIAGAMGAYLMLFPYSRVNVLFMLYFISVIRVPVLLLLGLWVLLQLFSGVGQIGISAAGGVAYWAHLGGFVIGVIVIATVQLIRREPILPPRRHKWMTPRETENYYGS